MWGLWDHPNAYVELLWLSSFNVIKWWKLMQSRQFFLFSLCWNVIYIKQIQGVNLCHKMSLRSKFFHPQSHSFSPESSHRGSSANSTGTWMRTATVSTWLGVTRGPDPDWDLLTYVWASTDTRGLNLYPWTSCCVQNHLCAFLHKVCSSPGSIERKEWTLAKNNVIGKQCHLHLKRSPRWV